MSCQNQPCIVSTCDPQSSLNFYIGLTSIQSNPTYSNVSEIVVPVNYGTGYYIVGPGTIDVVVTQNATTIDYQGCQSAISLPVPAGATQVQINAIVQQVMQQAAQQLSQCNAPAPTNPFDAVLAPTLYSNAVKSSGCSGFPGIKVTGSLPAGITVNPSSVTVAAGIFTSSISQEDADSQASLFLIYFIESRASCGWWNTMQICTGGGQVAANLYFSTVSQDDANAQAVTGGCVSGFCPDWTTLSFGPPIPAWGGAETTGDGVANFNFTGSSLETFNFSASASGAANGQPYPDCTAFPNRSYLDHTDGGGPDQNGCGVVSYNGTGCNCNLRVDWTAPVSPDAQDQIQVYISIMIAGCAYEALTVAMITNYGSGPVDGYMFCPPGTQNVPSNYATGVHNFPFTLPDTGGSTLEVRVMVLSLAFGRTINQGYCNTVYSITKTMSYSASVLITNI